MREIRTNAGGRTHVVRCIWATHVKHGPREIVVCHLQSIDHAPQGCAKTVTETRKTATRRAVSLDHKEGLSDALSNSRRITVGGNEAGCVRVIEVGWEYPLGTDILATVSVGETIIGRIAGG